MTKYIILAVFIIVVLFLFKIFIKLALIALVIGGIYYFYKFIIAKKKWNDVDF